MDKFIRIRYSQKDNPRGMLVELEKTLDGVEWHLVFATRVQEGSRHEFVDVPNMYVHIDILNEIKKHINKGYKLID